VSDRNDYRQPTKLATGPQGSAPAASGTGPQDRAAVGTPQDGAPIPVYRDVTGRPIPLAAGWERPDGERPRENAHQQWAGAAQASDSDSGSLFAADTRQSAAEYRRPTSYPATAGGGAFFTGARQAARDQEAARSGPVRTPGAEGSARTTDSTPDAAPAVPPMTEPGGFPRTGEQGWSSFQDYERRADGRSDDDGHTRLADSDQRGGYDHHEAGAPAARHDRADEYGQADGYDRAEEPAEPYADHDDRDARYGDRRSDAPDQDDSDDRAGADGWGNDPRSGQGAPGTARDRGHTPGQSPYPQDRGGAPEWQQVHGSQPLSLNRTPASGSQRQDPWPADEQNHDPQMSPTWGPTIPQNSGQSRFGNGTGPRWGEPDGPVRPWDPIPDGPGAFPPAPVGGRHPGARHSRGQARRRSGRGLLIVVFVLLLLAAGVIGAWIAGQAGIIDTDGWPLFDRLDTVLSVGAVVDTPPT